MKKTTALLILVLFITVVCAKPALCRQEEPRQVYDQILENIIQSIMKGNFEAFRRDLDENMKNRTTLQQFQQMQEQLASRLGEVRKLKYLGTIDKGDYIWVLWQGSFEKYENEILIKMIIKKDGPKHLVSGLWFQ